MMATLKNTATRIQTTRLPRGSYGYSDEDDQRLAVHDQ